MAAATFIQTIATLLFNLLFYLYSITDEVGTELILSSVLGQFIRMISELVILKVGLKRLILIFHNNLYQIAIGFVISEYVLLVGYIIYIMKLKKS